MISGSQSLSSIHRFSNRHYSEICAGLEIEQRHRPLSYNTFRNAFKKIDVVMVESIFSKIFGKLKYNILHIDGKASKGSITNTNTVEQAFLMTVSAYSSEYKQTAARKSFNNKSSSEIEIVRELIKELQKGKLLTFDSAHCNKETVKIANEKHHYLAQFKGNQKNLKRTALELESKGEIVSEHYSEELNRGRIEKRLTKVYKYINSKWAGSKSIVIQERWRNNSHEKAFYLSNRVETVEKRANQIRKHWSVESMHWEKDVLMGEDSNKTKEQNLCCVMSCLRTFVLNRCKKSDIKSFSAFSDSYAHDIPKLFSLL